MFCCIPTLQAPEMHLKIVSSFAAVLEKHFYDALHMTAPEINTNWGLTYNAVAKCKEANSGGKGQA